MDEKWNSQTIRNLVENGQLKQWEIFVGQTADVLFGIAPDNAEVGMVLSKEKDGIRVIITGFESSRDYWKSV